MKYSTVIFDLDGTLINTLEDLTDAVNHALAAFDFPLRTVEEVRGFVGNGIPRLVHLALPEGAGEQDEAKCLDICKSYYIDHSAVKTAPYEGICELVSQLKKAGVKSAVVTNKIEDAAIEIVRGFFGGDIDVIIGQVDGLRQKPEPDGVFAALEKLGAEKGRSVYVGDSEVDCATAKNAGLPIIGCTWGFRGRALLEQCGADYIIDTPRQILDIVL